MIEEEKIPYINDTDPEAANPLLVKGFLDTSRGKQALWGSGNTVVGINSSKGIWLGASSFDNAPFRVTMDGALTTGGNITGATIAGGMIQTATSGKRIVISSNVMEFYNSADTNIASFNGGSLGASEFMTMDSPAAAPFYPLHIYQRGASTQGALRIDCADSGAGSRGLEIFQEGDKTALFIDVNSTSSGYAFEMDYEGTATQAIYILNNSASSKTAYFLNNSTSNTASCVDITQSGSGNALNVAYNKSGGSGYAIEVDYGGAGQGVYIHSDASTATQALYVTKDASTGIVAEFRNTKASSNDFAVAAFRRTATTSTNFKKILDLDNANVWVSDGTTPSGNLSGGTGDVCFNCDSGKAYYCGGGTTWTAM